MVEFTINLSVNKNDYTIMLISPVESPLPSMELDRKRATVKNVDLSMQTLSRVGVPLFLY